VTAGLGQYRIAFYFLINSFKNDTLYSMERLAFKMKLKPGYAAEYEKRHRHLWPELQKLLQDAGISDYSIFLDDESNTLFAVQKTTSTSGSQDLAKHDVVQRWWRYMADIMETNEDYSPVSVPLREVFRME
jgi:L-rhamnose mutarotase